MRTIFDPIARASIVTRIQNADATSKPRWGKMNVEQMLTHLVGSLRMALGELHAAPKKLLFRYAPLRQLIVYVLPWPKGSPTAPELLPSESAKIEDSRLALVQLVERVGTSTAQSGWPDHPAFGRLGRRAWGVLVWRHVDHHLRQFGL
jgi:hypothetical protein